jgi:hypothetical protein
MKFKYFCFVGYEIVKNAQEQRTIVDLGTQFLQKTTILYPRWQNPQFCILDDKISKNGRFGNYRTKLCVLCPDVRDKVDLLCFNIISYSRWQFQKMGVSITTEWNCVLCSDRRDKVGLLCFNIISVLRWWNLFFSFSTIRMSY